MAYLLVNKVDFVKQWLGSVSFGSGVTTDAAITNCFAVRLGRLGRGLSLFRSRGRFALIFGVGLAYFRLVGGVGLLLSCVFFCSCLLHIHVGLGRLLSGLGFLLGLGFRSPGSRLQRAAQAEE